MAPYSNDREVTYEIVEEIGIISEQATGWAKELNVVSWNGGQAKYDIRDWNPMHTQMGKGITLNEKEMRAIVDLLRRRARLRNRRSFGSQETRSREEESTEAQHPAEETADTQDYEEASRVAEDATAAEDPMAAEDTSALTDQDTSDAPDAEEESIA